MSSRWPAGLAGASRGSARRFVGALAGAIVLSQAVGVPSAVAVGGTIQIAASAQRITVGEDVTISGTLSAGAGCVDGRQLVLEWRRVDSSVFEEVAQGPAGSDGTFAFGDGELHTGAYRVTAPADGACEEAISDDALVGVRARVEATISTRTPAAGSCPKVTAIVTPPKPAQTVELERRVDGGWTRLEILLLDAGSHAIAHPCLGWQDVGPVRLRVQWPMQDTLNEPASGAIGALRVEPAGWMRDIEDLVEGRAMSVSVGEAGTFLYGKAPDVPRTPASNEKLLLSMALLDEFGADLRIRTTAAAAGDPVDGVIEGDLWLLGRGDPEVDRGTLAVLAGRIRAAGVRRLDGRVLGATTFFRRDWDAPGWHANARDYVARPTALTFDGNLTPDGRHEPDPEARAAEVLTEELEEAGIDVRGRPGSGRPPRGLTDVAAVRSRTLRALLARLLRPSDNFYAEVLGKRLGVAEAGAPGTIAKGAAALSGWAEGNGVAFTLNDSSGMSYRNRVSAEGIVRLLWVAEQAPWSDDLFEALPEGGQGTLRERLHGVQVRAKTGTLTGISALSGWVWLERSESWAEFSILSSGMPKWTASGLEDRIVRLVQNRAG